MFKHLFALKPGKKSARFSSWDVKGGNQDFWILAPGETRVLADIQGPAIITHIWSAFHAPWRELLLKFTWDDAGHPSIHVPFGDFFGLGHGIANSHQSALFSTSTNNNNAFDGACAHNCYVPMPFKKRAVVELENQSKNEVWAWFYIDYESASPEEVQEAGYFHAEFRRENPFGGWGPEVQVNSPETDSIMNTRREAWENNYVILDTRGEGHYIGCNMSVTNLQGSWWGEGDDMIWVDGYKWPPDFHGTGSEDYFNHGWGMQRNAYLRNGSSVFEHDTGGYQTSYVFHLENPVYFSKEIKVTIEAGHGNHLGNEISSVAYWYARNPTKVLDPPPVKQRLAIRKKGGKWDLQGSVARTTHSVAITAEMQSMRRDWARSKLRPFARIVGKIKVNHATALPDIVTSYMMSGPIEIPLMELLEDVGDSRVRLDLFGATSTGRIIETPKGIFVNDGMDDCQQVPVSPELVKREGSTIKIIVGRMLPEENTSPDTPAMLVKITDKITFRD